MPSDEDSFENEMTSRRPANISVVGAEVMKEMLAARRHNLGMEAEAFLRLRRRLRALLQSYYPPHFLAVLAGWGLRTAVGPRGVGNRTMIDGIFQHHVELLQAIALSMPSWEWGEEPASASAIQEIIEILLSLPDAFVAVRRSRAGPSSDPSVATVFSLQERLRLHTQMVRNWGGYRSMLEILRKQYAPLDAALRERNRYGALDVIAVIENTVGSIEAQVNDRFRLLKDIFKARTIPELVHDFFDRYPGVVGDPEAFLSSLEDEQTIDSIRAYLIVHADRWLVVSAIAPVTAIAKACDLSEEVTRTILDLISMQSGALSEEDTDHFFLSNPVWTKPGIRTGTDYFFAAPQTAVSFLAQILSSLYAEAGLKSRLENRRSVFLENETLRIVERALPGATIRPEAKWTWQGRTYETDLIVLVDKTVVIVECKSAALTPQGLRGAPDRVRRHIGELVTEPAVQSARLTMILDLARNGDAVARDVMSGLGLDPAEISAVIRVSVTLDDLTVLSSAESELKSAGWIPEDLDLPTTLNLADLACVTDILDRPSFLLDYFERRSTLQKSADVLGFELDWLGLYLTTNFALGETKGHLLVIPEMSEEIDRYYQNLEIGHPSDKPRPLVHNYIDAVIDCLEARRPHGWTRIAADLLSVGDLETQTECAESFEDLRLQALSLERGADQVNGFFMSAELRDDVVVVFHAFSRAMRDTKKEAVRALAEHALAQSGRSRCLFVSRMVETWEVVPYDTIGIFQAR
jgi:hypothetical protein